MILILWGFECSLDDLIFESQASSQWLLVDPTQVLIAGRGEDDGGEIEGGSVWDESI